MVSADIMQALNDTHFTVPLEDEQCAAASAYIASRAKVLGWSYEEQAEILLALFGEAKPIRRRHQKRPKATKGAT